MNETGVNITLLVLLVGSLVTLVILLKAGLARLGFPALVGYIGLGFVLRVINMNYGLFSEQAMELFDFLAKIGIIVLLFRIGLESNLKGLLHQLRRASVVWCAGVICNMGLGYIVSYFLLGLGIIPSLFIATAMTATSVGISVGVWDECNAIGSPNGELLVDIAELDDISSIIVMALLFAIAPVLRGGSGDTAGPQEVRHVRGRQRRRLVPERGPASSVE